MCEKNKKHDLPELVAEEFGPCRLIIYEAWCDVETEEGRNYTFESSYISI